MAYNEELLVQESTIPIISGADPSRPPARLAHFLLPRADGARLPALPSPPRNAGPILGDKLQVEFRCWAGSPKQWRRWVAKLRPQHERLWREVGILDAILATTYRVRRDEGVLLQLAAFWSGETSTFIFPWGEATVTLEDVAVLGGLPLLGKPVCALLPDALCGDVDALDDIRSVLNRSKNKKPNYAAWVKHFLERPPEDEASDGDGGGEAARLLEHQAFLALWLSVYVLPSPPFDVVQARVFPIAARLARGQRVALAPAALASIYNYLSALKRYINMGKDHKPFVGCAPLHVLQLWVWERFPELRPEVGSSPDPNDGGVVPRVARWHDVRKVLGPGYIHAVFMSPEGFEWRPYGSSSFALPPGKGGCWLHGQDIARSKELLSLALCLRPCELVGSGCIEQYCPHRVARQLGFDQDVPGTVARANSDSKVAWGTYKMEPKDFAFIVPHYDPGVTIEYAQWWEPYSSACAVDVANAVRMKQLPVLVNPRKRNMKGIPGVDAAEDSQDDLPLVERLNGIIQRMHRQGAAGHVLKGAASTQESEIVKDLVPERVRNGRKRSHILITYDEKNITSEYGKLELHHVEGAASTGNNQAIKTPIVVDVQSTPEDIIVISDDDFHEVLGKDDDVVAMHLKSSKLVTSTSNSTEPNEDKQLVSTRKDQQGSPVLKDNGVQNNCECELASVRDDSTIRQEPVDMPSSSPINRNIEPVKRVVCTKTLYYLRRFRRMKDAQMSARGTNADQGFFQPRREVGTREMIREASETREAEKVELEKRIDRLKKQIWH